MSKFKLNSEVNYSTKKSKKYSNKKHFNEEDGDFTDFAYMKRSNAKNELRHIKDLYGI